MDMVGKGSKPVVYKRNVRLRFYSTSIEDSEIKADSIFAKITDMGTAVVYGEYEIFLLYSYLNSNKQKIYMTETQKMSFNEEISCNLPKKANNDSFAARASFDPHIKFERGAQGSWNVTVGGQIDVFVYGNKDRLLANAPNTNKSTGKDHATVMRIDSEGLSADDLLNMDEAMIAKLSDGSIISDTKDGSQEKQK